MASPTELDTFLASVEKRAFKQAVYAIRDDDTALDLVQEAMIKLATKYVERPAAEWPMLFQRILQNVINDHFRRQKVRNTWITLLSNLRGDDDDDGSDPLETIEAEQGTERAESTADKVEREQIMTIIESEIQKLPRRQREAFLLRYWEDMDVAETAQVMGCSQGSVKTHCSRANHALAEALLARGISL
jgi:RNA polymerase sigma-70 factor, ECF subfamily